MTAYFRPGYLRKTIDTLRVADCAINNLQRSDVGSGRVAEARWTPSCDPVV